VGRTSGRLLGGWRGFENVWPATPHSSKRFSPTSVCAAGDGAIFGPGWLQLVWRTARASEKACVTLRRPQEHRGWAEIGAMAAVPFHVSRSRLSTFVRCKVIAQSAHSTEGWPMNPTHLTCYPFGPFRRGPPTSPMLTRLTCAGSASRPALVVGRLTAGPSFRTMGEAWVVAYWHVARRAIQCANGQGTGGGLPSR